MDVEIYAYGTTIDYTQIPENATVYVKAERAPDRDGDSVMKYEEVGNEDIR
jgi:hypothetical protein